VRLNAIRLRNWKAFPHLDLDLQPASTSRNVIIIEGSNGFGKTSLLEAVILCLYGREGVGLVGRASAAGRPEKGYDAFLERALHQGARGADCNASVELIFEGKTFEGERRASDGAVEECSDRFAIQRIWYFTKDGRHRRTDEEVRIWTGPDEDLLPLAQGDEQNAEVRDLVSRHLLPSRLAPFFLFDGEHLDRLAGVDLEQQVRLAVEAALGVPLLRLLGEDLRSYARDRRSQLKTGSETGFDALVADAAALDSQQRQWETERDSIVQRLAPLREERDATVARIGALHGESYASFKTLFEEREHNGRSRDALQDQLRQTLSFDLALALAGPTLRNNARAQIASDARAEQMAATRSLGQGRYSDVIARLGGEDERALIGLDQDQWTVLNARLDAIWNEVWRSDQDDVLVQVHGHLSEADRHMVDRRLAIIDQLGADAIRAIAKEAEAADTAVAMIDRRIAEQRGTDATSQQLADRLGEIQEEISALEETARSLGRNLEGGREDLATKEREVARMRALLDSDAPALARADTADKVGRAIAILVDRLFPLNLEVLSGAISQAYRAMAHKSSIAEIRIDPDGTVLMLDADGRDTRALDASAGESQLFAFALMAAITGISAPFPLILDTPLARLDPEHRKRVLRYFASLERQIIFLSQPAEISADYLRLLEPQLDTVIHLAHEAGRSSTAPTLKEVYS
jgi:DNA sulfur modification protein DndD